MAELLLLSTSRAPGQAFLEHAADAIRSILGDRTAPHPDLVRPLLMSER
jgi:hypothetical protein